jgi:hypothetical protein
MAYRFLRLGSIKNDKQLGVPLHNCVLIANIHPQLQRRCRAGAADYIVSVNAVVSFRGVITFCSFT